MMTIFVLTGKFERILLDVEMYNLSVQKKKTFDEKDMSVSKFVIKDDRYLIGTYNCDHIVRIFDVHTGMWVYAILLHCPVWFVYY